jgi:hypothetical protein
MAAQPPPPLLLTSQFLERRPQRFIPGSLLESRLLGSLMLLWHLLQQPQELLLLLSGNLSALQTKTRVKYIE